MTFGWSMNVMVWIAPPHCGQSRGSTLIDLSNVVGPLLLEAARVGRWGHLNDYVCVRVAVRLVSGAGRLPRGAHVLWTSVLVFAVVSLAWLPLARSSAGQRLAGSFMFVTPEL